MSSYRPSVASTTFATRCRPLPPGSGPLDTSGLPLSYGKGRTAASRTGRVDVPSVTYETTHRISDTTGRAGELKGCLAERNDSFSNIYGRTHDYKSTSSSLYSPTSRYSISTTSGTGSSKYTSSSSSYVSDENRIPASRRRSSISDRISQFEPSYRNLDITTRSPSQNVVASSTSPVLKDTSGLTGLRNLRNTCFMNSILQCLSNTKPLLEYCLNDEFVLDINEKTSHMRGQLFRSYANLMKELWKKKGDSCVSPTSFKSSIAKFAPRFVGYSQQDSQEFLRYLLEGLHEDVNRVTSRPKLPAITEDEDEKLSETVKPKFYWDRYLKLEKSVIVDIFVGQLRSTLKCTECSYESTTYDPFWDLSLPIPKYTSNVQLTDCIRHFTAEEVLDGDEKPTCARCKARRKCTKSFSVQRFPQILVLHLKRFSGERFRSKLTTSVNFPLNDLDLSQFSADTSGAVSCTYNCISVSNHSGTVYSGHYTAHCKHPNSGDWHEYNDQSVRPIPTRSIVSSEAYVLFYELCNKQSRL